MLGLSRRQRTRIETERLTLRLPEHSDWRQWSELREASAAFLVQ
ncbi:MAG: 30S ribosomal protein S5 alanine N-acetyltransferase, partial [Tabrizicola sp.]|nr:30S ribosomal protein S5 alanine N-acetyltransferase [Tabrizicola sp.]